MVFCAVSDRGQMIGYENRNEPERPMFGAGRKSGILRGLQREKREEGLHRGIMRVSTQRKSSVCRQFSHLGGLGISRGWCDVF